MDTDNKFGDYIRGIRKEKKMTIRQLDLYSGVSHSYISQLERGERAIPSPDIIKKISSALNVPYEEIMIQAGYIEEQTKKNDLKPLTTNDKLNDVAADYNRLPQHKQKLVSDLIKSLLNENIDTTN